MATIFVPVPGNAWRTILSKQTRHAFDELTTELGVSLEDIQDAINSIETDVEDIDLTHQLLDTPVHTDTETNPPLPGALVVGRPAASVDLSLYWVDGQPVDFLNTVEPTGGVKYWMDGLPFSAVTSLTDGDVVWVRLVVGPNGYVLTSTGTGVEWAEAAAITSRPSVSAPMAAAQAIPVSTPTLITLDTPEFDSGPFWSAASPTRLTVPVEKGGVYLALGQITWTLSNLGPLRARLLVNGTAVARDEDGNLNGAATISQNLSKLLTLNAGDYVELEAFQSGTVGTVTAGTGESFLQLVKQ